ncbi:MAG TPA: hypothetical protein VFQ00_06970 [Terriglobales bacterium]|nr:hypothetical protein [Terriglobales bacterium]
MRRFAANSLLIAMLALFFAPALAAAVPVPVPACCRRGGQHHCMAMAVAPESTGFRRDSRCPMRLGAQLCSMQAALPGFGGSQLWFRTSSLIFSIRDSGPLLLARADHLRGPPPVLA